MSNVKLIKPDKDTAFLLDYKLCLKNKTDWKNAYLRRCMVFGEEPISQGDMSDYDYYRLVVAQKFQYYLLDGDEVVGRALLERRGSSFIDIQYLLIEEEFRGKGYGTHFFKLLEEDIFKDESVEGILIEDASKGGLTSIIAQKLGYEEYECGMFMKYNKGNLNFKSKR